MSNESANQAMLHIMALDPNASLQFSQYTGKWFVAARISIGDGATLTMPTVHHDLMTAAVVGYFIRLVAVDMHNHDQVLVTDENADRKHWRWNGAAFVEQPIPVPGEAFAASTDEDRCVFCGEERSASTTTKCAGQSY